MPPVQQLWVVSPNGGEAPSLPPDSLAPDTARALRNFLVHHPGRVIPRGELGGPRYSVPTGTITRADGGQLLSLGVADDLIIASYRSPTATPKVDPWRAPINRATSSGDLATPSDDGGSLAVTTGVFTPITGVAALSVQGPSICRVDQALYTATAGGTATLVNGFYDVLNAVRKVAIGGSGVVLTNGPRFVRAVFSHYGRVFAAGARRPGGSDYDPSQIFYTLPGGSTALTDVATDWQDPVTGELNRIAVGAANDGDFVVGFGRAAGHLLIFKRHSVWILYGTSPANFTLRQLRTLSGCVDFRSIVVADEGTYFASQLGYELFDGTKFSLLSEPIADVWLPISNDGVASGSVNHAFIKADALPNNYLHVSLGTDSHVSGAPDGTTRAWLLHCPSGSWIDLRTNLAGLGLGAAGFLNRCIVTASTVTAWSGTGGWARADRLTYGHDTVNGLADSTASTDYNVDLVWRTGILNLGSNWSTVQLHALTVSGAWNYVSGAASPPAWATVEASDGSGAVLVPEWGLEGFAAPGPDRCRPMHEKKHESARGDLSIQLESSTGASAATQLGRCELYGLGVGFVVGRERHLS